MTRSRTAALRTGTGRLVAASLALLAGIAAAPIADRPVVALRGVNFAGAEFAADKLPGRPDFDYVYPTDAQLDWAASMGFTVIRLPVLWERLQPTLNHRLDPDELGRLGAVMAAADRRGLSLIIDVHNFGAYRGHKIGSPEVPGAAFADLWGRLSEPFGRSPRVLFGLMNEPNEISAEAWLPSLQVAVDAIRQGGARNRILVSGTGWDGAHNFVSGSGYGTPNAIVLDQLVDPAHALVFEVHQYLDDDHSGTHPECPEGGRVAALLGPFTDWLRAGHRTGFLGEFAASSRPECLAALGGMLAFMDDNRDVWAGWTYWAAGAWWGPDYMFSTEPQNGRARPQMSVLRATAR